MKFAFRQVMDLPCKSDETMFLPLAKAMHLRRDVCLWHVADNYITRALRPFPRRALFCVAARSVVLLTSFRKTAYNTKH